MVRATAAEVVKKWPKGAYPASWDATSVGHICTQVDAEIDAKARPSVFGTGTNHIEFANMLAFRRCNHGTWAGGQMQTMEPNVWTREMEEWFQSLLTSTDLDSVATVKSQGDS